MKESMIRIMLCEPCEDPKIVEIENEYEVISATVGGYIECISPFRDMEVDLVCNEEGKLIGLTPNRKLTMKDTKEHVDTIVGTFFFVSYDDEGNFKSLSDEQIEKIKSEHRVTLSSVWVQ